jgi:iron complex outermembrane receptor protein
MSKPYSHTLRDVALAGAATAAMIPALAFGQEEQETERSAESADANEIVVTGSLIRGAAPVGSNLIAVGQETLESSGATSSNELLATIPQVTNYFNTLPAVDLNIAANQIQISRPNLRNITPRAAASSATLILFDGHRIATAGTRQASVDPDVIPSGAIERVEVVTEGGSATYGADAVAGVINFITRKRFDGVKVDARYGFADDYWQFDANATIGKDWGSGSAYISYTFTKNRALFGRDRDFVRSLDYSRLPYTPLGRSCDAANIRFADGTNYAVQNLTTPGLNVCDTSDDSSVIPAAVRHGVLASLYQELSPTTSVETKAFYSERTTKTYGTYRGTVTIGPNNPNFRPIPGRATPNANQSVDFSFGPVLGRGTAESRILIQEWGVSTELRQHLGDNWQVRGLFNYSRSNTQYNQPGVNSARLAAAGNCTTGTANCPLSPSAALNPYDIASTRPELLADLIDNENAAQAKDELLDLRLITDGSLFTLPGGAVRLAVGYEFMKDRLQQREVSNVRLGGLSTTPYKLYSRQVHSLFGEVNIPLFGPENASPGFESLVISAQGRWDSYSDFGSTFNPKLGVSYKPVDWLTLRGNWGTSFTAPTPLDQLNQTSQASFFGFAFFIRPEDRLAGVNSASGTMLSVQGSRPNLQPQTAETWSLGFDVDPPFFPGLRASVSYYNVKFDNIISIPTPNDGIFINFPGNIQTSNVLAPATGFSEAYLRALYAPGGLLAGALNGQGAVEEAINAGRPVYAIVDFRVGNFGIVKVEGLDFSVNYRTEFGFGSLDLGVNGNYVLSRKSQESPGAPLVDLVSGNAVTRVDGSPRFSLQTIAGATIGNLRAQVTWNHTSGYPIPPTPLIAMQPTPQVPVQTRIGAFDTVNLFFKYDLNREAGLMKDLSFTLNVNNVFDQDPPVALRTNSTDLGYANGFTLGRMFIFGVSKRF